MITLSTGQKVGLKLISIFIIFITGCQEINMNENRLTRAVTIGLNSVNPAYYGGWSGKLPDCEFDATFAAEMWQEHGIETRTLLTAEATIENCKQALKDSLVGMSEGDWLIVWISGHGGQMADSGGDETDKLDEYICAYDGPVMDDTINEWLDKVPAGVCVLWICDTCHSGTMHKKPPIFSKKAVRDFKGQLILISGSAESGYALSTGQGGVLSTALHDTGPEGQTPASWYKAAKALIPEKTQSPQYVEYGKVTNDFRNGQIVK